MPKTPFRRCMIRSQICTKTVPDAKSNYPGISNAGVVFALVSAVVFSMQSQCASLSLTCQSSVTSAYPSWLLAIMIFRISSMYGHSRKIKVVLLVGFLLHVLAEAILGVLLSPAQLGTLPHRLFPIITIPKAQSFIPDLVAPSSLKSCLRLNPVGWSWVVWISRILFELLLFVLAVRIGIRNYHAMKVIQRLNRGIPGGSSLLYVLLRDSAVFPFLCVSSFISIKYE